MSIFWTKYRVGQRYFVEISNPTQPNLIQRPYRPNLKKLKNHCFSECHYCAWCM